MPEPREVLPFQITWRTDVLPLQQQQLVHVPAQLVLLEKM